MRAALAIGEERRFDGQYIGHWEVPRFEFVSGTRVLGLMKRWERCQLETAEGVPSIVDALYGGTLPLDSPRSPGQRFAVSFVGRVLERGHFGHKGFCRWRLLVTAWLRVQPC